MKNKVKVVWSTLASDQYETFKLSMYDDPRAKDIVGFISSFVERLAIDPFAKIGKKHHKLVHSGHRKGGYSCSFPETSNGGRSEGLRFTYEVYDVHKGSMLDSLPHYVLSHVSAEDSIDFDYIVFIQDAVWDYHDADTDSKRLKHRDSNDLPREAWISRQEASFIRGGFKPDTARRLAEDYYDIRALRGDYSAVYIQNPDKSFTKL